MEKELHLIVLWARSRYKESEIISDIKLNLDIKKIYEIEWSKDKVAQNFSRFYGQKLPDNSFKEKECGKGAFLAIVVEDKNPEYDFVETSRGHEKANLKLFNLKEKYREWTGGGHKIHITNSIQETEHDSALLLGLNYNDLKKEVENNTDLSPVKLKQDIIGANGWKSLNEFFYVLNATINYVVLRNYEILPENYKGNLHGDIDILSDNYENLVFIANSNKVFEEEYRVHNCTLIGKETVYFDFRYINDNYYDYHFEKAILDNRVLNEKNIYVPNDKYYFYSLVYHSLVQKKVIADDYYEKIYNLFVKNGFDKKYNIKDYASPFDLYFELLTDFMKENNYNFVRPIDKSVLFSYKFAEITKLKDFFEKNYGFKNLECIHTDLIPHEKSIFFKAKDASEITIFIKCGNLAETYKNEYKYTKLLYEINPINFIKPMYYRENTGYRFFANEYTEGKSLVYYMENNLLSVKQKADIIKDIYDIFKTLDQTNIINRDINPENLIYDGKHIKLIDFQFAIEKNCYRECPYLSGDIYELAGLGREFKYKCYHWDDAYSLLKVLEYIGCCDEYKDDYEKFYSEIKNAIGKKYLDMSKKYVKILKKIYLKYKFQQFFNISPEKRGYYRMLASNTKKIWLR